MADIVECVRRENRQVAEINRVGVVRMQDGIDIYVAATFRRGERLDEAAARFQRTAVERIEEMTSFNVNRLDLEVRGLI